MRKPWQLSARSCFWKEKKVLPKVFMTVSVKSTVNLLEKIIRYHSPNYANNLNLFIIKRLIEKIKRFFNAQLSLFSMLY